MGNGDLFWDGDGLSLGGGYFEMRLGFRYFCSLQLVPVIISLELALFARSFWFINAQVANGPRGILLFHRFLITFFLR